jgi:undecaprenyl-diphosphatase
MAQAGVLERKISRNRHLIDTLSVDAHEVRVAARFAMARRMAVAFERFDRAELRLCRYLNRSSASVLIRPVFRAVSWLGDGWAWYALIASLPLIYGSAGWLPAVHMAVTGAAGVLVYKVVKKYAVRERPYITHSVIQCVSAPLDRYSFPSGHTLHAISFALLMTSYFPEWWAPLAAFALLIALSRVILGLHYPTDVAAGAALGGSLAFASLAVGRQLVGG